GHINTIMIRKNALFCKLIRIKKSSKVLFESYMASFFPEREACPICGSSGNCHVHAYYGRRIIDFIHGKPVLQEITVLRLVCESCAQDRKSTRLNSSHVSISYAVFCLKKKK